MRSDSHPWGDETRIRITAVLDGVLDAGIDPLTIDGFGQPDALRVAVPDVTAVSNQQLATVAARIGGPVHVVVDHHNNVVDFHVRARTPKTGDWLRVSYPTSTGHPAELVVRVHTVASLPCGCHHLHAHRLYPAGHDTNWMQRTLRAQPGCAHDSDEALPVYVTGPTPLN